MSDRMYVTGEQMTSRIRKAAEIMGIAIAVLLMITFFAAKGQPRAHISEKCIPVYANNIGEYPNIGCKGDSINLYIPTPLYMESYAEDINRSNNTLEITIYASKKPRVSCIRQVEIEYSGASRIIIQRSDGNTIQKYIEIDPKACAILPSSCGK